MKFSFNWLREITPFTWISSELAERLTMAGIEVEGIEIQGQGFDNVIVAQILKSEPHPNADRLSVCEVDTGLEKKQIVCGAKNYQVVDKVPLALSGAKLPNGMEIKRSKLRGVESDGMMCSPKELGLADDAQGLMILPSDLQIGLPVATALRLDDIIFDLEITPNRPDLLSHWGLAREIAVLAKLNPLNRNQLFPEDEKQSRQSSNNGNNKISIRVNDPQRCPRYTAQIIRGIKVGPSPLWLQSRLESLGQRSISNLVDITNYILQEIGQPLHAFDLRLLEGPEIIVRLAQPGEKLLQLDDQTSELNPDMLVIADAHRPVALAGIIGGKETGVSSETTDILLESATFQSTDIRKTAKKLGLFTESSYRFERGVDIELAAWASKRATQLILQVCGGQIDESLVDIRSSLAKKRQILCRYQKINSLLGTPILADEVDAVFKGLGCTIKKELPESKSCEVEPPSYRLDLEREIDLVEEVGRIHGIEKIPSRVSSAAVSTTQESASFLFARQLRSLATGLGLNEAFNYTIISSRHLPTPGTEKNSLDSKDIRLLANPLTSEMDFLRPSLLDGLLQTVTRNLAGSNTGCAFFELGNVFKATDESTFEEKPVIGIILAGKRQDGASWEKGIEGKSYDFYDLKGIVETLIERVGVKHEDPKPISIHHSLSLQPGVGFEFIENNKTVASTGKIKHSIAESFKCSADVFYAELDCQWLQSSEKKFSRYQPWAVYPSIRRDIAVTVLNHQKHQGIAETLWRIGKKYAEKKKIFLQDVELFDIFKGEKVGIGKKSLTYSIIYRSPEKTLTDSEVNEVHEAIKANLKEEIGCEIRE